MSGDSSPIDFVLESDEDEDEEMEDIDDSNDAGEEGEDIVIDGGDGDYSLHESDESDLGIFHDLAEELAPTSAGSNRETAGAGKALEGVVGYNSVGRKLGKSPLPLSRVAKVVKADKVRPVQRPRRATDISPTNSQEIGSVSKDALFLISLATEAFIAKLAVESHWKAKMEKRTMVQLRDIVSVSNQQFLFHFLEGTTRSVQLPALHPLNLP